MNIATLRLTLASLRQLLRDNSQNMTEDQINEILDRIALILNVLNDLEKTS